MSMMETQGMMPFTDLMEHTYDDGIIQYKLTYNEFEAVNFNMRVIRAKSVAFF